MAPIHKRFSDSQLKDPLQRYPNKEIKRPHIQGVLGIRKRRFFAVLDQFRIDPSGFTIRYTRMTHPRISQDVEYDIPKEVQVGKALIEDKNVPLRRYNYGYARDRLWKTYGHTASPPNVNARARRTASPCRSQRRRPHTTAKCCRTTLGN